MPVGLLAFDVNETLLSLRPMRDHFEERFGADLSFGEWFARILHGSILANVLDLYRPFGEIGVDALLGVAQRRGYDLAVDDARSVIALMSEAPPHPDVVPAIQRLAEDGIRMIALTNGSADVADRQIHNAGLSEYLERVISVDEVQRFKPDPIVYLHASEVMGVDIEEMVLVASHDWDCAGAMASGAQAIFIKRPGVVWGLPTPPPDTQVPDIGKLADALGA